MRNLRPGDRVVIPSTVGCGYCSYCRSGYYAQCDNANPNGASAGTCFFGGPQTTGPVDGLQAEFARIPFANVGPVWLPDEVTDDQAIMLSDIYPTAWFGCRLAEIGRGDTVLVLGAGPVGQFAVTSAFQQGAGRVLVVDGITGRLDQARGRGAEAIDFNSEDPVAVVQELTGGVGVDRVVDAVGVDAQRPQAGTRRREGGRAGRRLRGGAWSGCSGPGTRRRQLGARRRALPGPAVGRGGRRQGRHDRHHRRLSRRQMSSFPLGAAMNKNLTVKAGNCNHRRYIPELLDLVRTGAVDPATVLTQSEALSAGIEAYETFDRRESGWTKVVFDPAV